MVGKHRVLVVCAVAACSDDSAEPMVTATGSATSHGASETSTVTGDASRTDSSDTAAGSSSAAADATSTSGDASSSESSTANATGFEPTGSDTGSTTTTSSTSTSASEDTTAGGAAVCGNALLETDEVCDDGNLVGGDGCEDDCTSSDDVLPIWTFEQGGPFGFVDCGGDTAFDSGDNLILAGLYEDQIWVGKFDTTYALLWEVTYPAVQGAGGCLEVRVAVDADDNVAVIGPQTLNPGYLVFVAKLDPDGVEQWTSIFGESDPPVGDAGDIAFDSAGNILLTGELLNDDVTDRTYWVQVLDPDGTPLWSDSYFGVGCCSNGGKGIAAGPDGDVWAVGYESPGMYTTDVFMRHYDALGGIITTEILPSVDIHSQDIAFAVTLDSAGDRIVGGYHRPDLDIDDNDAWLRRYDEGTELWMATFEGDGGAEDAVLGIAMAPDETIVVSGLMYDAAAQGLRNRWVAKIAGDGETVWQRRHPSESSDEGWRGVAVASDGRIAVAGVASFAYPWMAESRYAVYPP